jgi:hypothetical protein
MNQPEQAAIGFGAVLWSLAVCRMICPKKNPFEVLFWVIAVGLLAFLILLISYWILVALGGMILEIRL